MMSKEIGAGLNEFALTSVGDREKIMQPSLSTCQGQEARQRAIARDALLPNARQIAIVAANAWAKEGLLAAKREARKQGQLDPEDAAIAAESLADRNEVGEKP